ncbi:hypothetical protein QJS66_23060 [Kocuria rhizophila]|nr:hypothetical protein QJS66_23060 [Kocuria rhizophila]
MNPSHIPLLLASARGTAASSTSGATGTHLTVDGVSAVGPTAFSRTSPSRSPRAAPPG